MNKKKLTEKLEAIWYSNAKAPLGFGLLAKIYAKLAQNNRQRGQKRQYKHLVPIIIVGNITIGGTGKTPLIIALVELLKKQGYKPGVVSRGYGGHNKTPQIVEASSDPLRVGDEPVLIAKRTDCPVAVSADRNRAVHLLLNHCVCDLILADDGLQHYRLHRDLEIAVMDSERGLGNQQYLPLGPLRETPERLQRCDFVVINGEGHYAEEIKERFAEHAVTLSLKLEQCYKLDDFTYKPLSHWRDETVNAIAGIGHPERFFKSLEAAGLKVKRHSYPDHYSFEQCPNFENEAVVFMTEKDAVKYVFCVPKEHDGRYWVVPITAQLDSRFKRDFLERVQAILQDYKS